MSRRRSVSPFDAAASGHQNIKLGPTLPAFISPNVLAYLVEHYHIAPITTPEADLKEILGRKGTGKFHS